MMHKKLEGCLRQDLKAIAKNRNSWPLLREGVRIHTLREGPVQGESSALLSYEIGARVPRHLHVGAESILVLEGTQVDETGEYGEGCWMFNPIGTEHSVYAPNGCLVLIHWKAPVVFLDEN